MFTLVIVGFGAADVYFVWLDVDAATFRFLLAHVFIVHCVVGPAHLLGPGFV